MNYTRRKFSLTVASAIAALTLPGVRSGVASAGPRTIPHQLGITEIAGTPARVVALEFSFVQAFDSLGVVPVGISDDNQPARIEQLLGRKIDYSSVGTRLEPNLELISALAPELIVADEIRHSAIYAQLSAIAPTIVLNSWEGTYSTIKNSVVTIADAIGAKAQGIKAVAEHEATIAALAAKIPNGEPRRFLLAVAIPDSVSLHSSSSFSGSLFNAMGLKPAIESTTAIEIGVGLERLIAVNPDVLLVAADSGGSVLEKWKGNSAFESISAVKSNQVLSVDRNQFARFRGLKTAELMAEEILTQVYGVQ